jgi:hypothetical protein
VLCACRRTRVSARHLYHSHQHCLHLTAACTTAKMRNCQWRLCSVGENPINFPASCQGSFSIAASAATTSGFLLVCLSKMTRYKRHRCAPALSFASFPIKPSDHSELKVPWRPPSFPPNRCTLTRLQNYRRVGPVKPEPVIRHRYLRERFA